MSYNYSHIGHSGFGKATWISERKSPLQALPGWSGPGSSFGTEPVGRRAKAALDREPALSLSLPGEASAIHSPAHADHEDILTTHKTTVWPSNDVYWLSRKTKHTQWRHREIRLLPGQVGEWKCAFFWQVRPYPLQRLSPWERSLCGPMPWAGGKWVLEKSLSWDRF